MLDFQGGNVTVMVTNLNTAIDFYTEVLGFQLIQRFCDHWADIQAPEVSIGLHPTTKAIERGSNLQIGLRVKDLEKAIEELRSNEIEVKIQEDDQVRLAFFFDPDGNTLYLVQPQW
ncbi:MAG: VOC family protein [Bacteroidota bacterium]|nr:VOC family protein [Bacteroidota bacterium]MDX5428172.1 VOC family protein [Bacteroidota bacterium]MDX5448049.1 VOC family protein [Bacteroidota bacterium]